MLKIEKLLVSILGTPILRNVGMKIETGSTVGLIGRNGAGKTTLIRSIMGLIPAQSGQIYLDKSALHEMPAHARAHLAIGYMPEDRRLVPQFTVEENILVPLWATKDTIDPNILSWIYDLMPEIARFSDRKALSLSGGQQKLVALGRALAVGSNLLLLDEPFEGVAPALAQRLMEVIATLKEKGVTVLLSESDHVHSASLVDAIFQIERGEVSVRNH